MAAGMCLKKYMSSPVNTVSLVLLFSGWGINLVVEMRGKISVQVNHFLRQTGLFRSCTHLMDSSDSGCPHQLGG